MSRFGIALRLTASVGALLVAACAGGGGGASTSVTTNSTGGSSGSSGITAVSSGSGSGVTITNNGTSGGSNGTGGSSGNTSNGSSGGVSGNLTGITGSGFNGGVTVFNFDAPAPATVGTNATNPPAISTPQNGTAYPLKQTAIAITSSSIEPDTTANSGGATISIVNWNASGDSQFRLTIPGIGLDETFTSSTLFKGASSVTVNALQLAATNLSYTALGLWEVTANTPTTHIGAYATGYETPSSSMPTTGTATYSGSSNVAGLVTTGNSGGTFTAALLGDASLSANFATGAVTGNFTNMTATDLNSHVAAPWNNVSVNASIISGTSHFSGSTAATSAPSGTYAVSGTATGHIDGGFYGPNAQELGAVWSLASSPTAAIGVVGAMQPTGSNQSSGAGSTSTSDSIYASTSGSGSVTVLNSGGITGAGSITVNTGH